MDDSDFGPRLLDHFDFTLLFEHTIFYIAPSSIIIFAAPYYIYTILRGTRIVRAGSLLWLKLACAAALIAIHVANAVLWSESPLTSPVSNAAAVLSCVAAVCVAILVLAGHVYFLQPQPFIAFYLSVTMLLDIATTLTYFNRTGLEAIARLHIPIPALKLTLICLEEVSKRRLIRSEALRASLGHEALAGFWNRSLLVWVNSVLLFGFKNEITTDALPNLGLELESESLYGNFAIQWAKVNRASKWGLLKACVYTCPWPFLYIILPRLFAIGFDFSQPFLLQDVVNTVASETETSKDVMRGLILATATVYVGKAVSRSWYGHLGNHMAISLRGIVISAVYHKSLTLSTEDLDAEAAITLMTADAEGVNDLISLSYDSWARVLEMSAGIAILGAFVGAATLFTIIPVIGTTVWSAHVATKMMGHRKIWNEHVEARVAATSNILAQIKETKMLGLTPLLLERVQKQFLAEVDISMTYRKFLSETFGISAIAELLTPVVVVAATLFWTRASEPITAAKFFTTLAVVTLITNPLFSLIHTFGSWSTGFACLGRIQEYLNMPEVEDSRKFANQNETGEQDHSNRSVEAGASSSLRNRNAPPTALVVFAVQVVRVSVCTDLAGSILTDITMDVPMGGITMILGPVGCGKSTLLKTILGETKIRCGSVTLASRSVSYCDQLPWIQNDTIQANILCGRPMNTALYRKVVFICALDVDIARLPNGDKTLAGSDGCNLSGGQKQRISLARSLYSQAELIVLDDVMSALDPETSSNVRIRLFSESDILESGMSTIVMTTSMREHLVDADLAYELDEEGRIDLFATREREREQQRRNGSAQGQQTNSQPNAQSSIQTLLESTDSNASTSYDPPEAKEAENDNMREYLSSNRYGDWSLYKYFLSPAGFSNIVFWILTVALAALADRFPPIFVRIWLDRDSQNRLYFIGFALLSALAPCLYYLAPMFLYKLIIQKAAPALHQDLISTTSRATFEFLTDEDAGALLNRYSQDISMATQHLPGSIQPVIWGFCALIVDVGVICTGATYAIPIIPFFVLILFVLQHFYLQTSRQLRILELDSSKALVRHFTETGVGIEHIRAFQRQPEFAAQLYRILDKTQKPHYSLFSIQLWLTSVLELITAVAAVCVVSIALNFKRSTSATAMGLALLNLVNFSEFTGNSIRWFIHMENLFGAVSRIRDFKRRTPLEKDGDECEDVPQQWPASGGLRLNCVSAVYKPESEKPHIALENITVDVQPGQTLGLIGRTGSGKTSVILALLHLLEYTGSIYIDGRELRTVPRDLLRTRLTTITQGGVILKATVRFNMDPFEFTSRPGNFPTDDTLAGILRRVGLWDHVVRHGGLGAPMKSMKFSVGQRQLFQLARAILHKQITRSSLVLIDEGTASMDEDTERHVYELIREVFADCTKVIISHRDTLLAGADVVLNLADGRGEVFRPQNQRAGR